MIGTRAVPPPTGRELRACGLAALAEAGLVYLPVHLVLDQSGSVGMSVNALALPFILVFVATTVAACALRTRAEVPTVAGAAAVVLGLSVGRGDLNREVFLVVVLLLVAARAVMLGFRDWREPISASMGWGAVALMVETVLATGPQRDWRPLLIAIVPLFFAASLASRAAIVWTSDPSGDLSDPTRAGWLRRALALIGALAATMVAAIGLGVRGGLLERIGGMTQTVVGGVAAGLAYLMAQLARPIFWLVDRLHVDPSRARSLLRSFREHVSNLDRSHAAWSGGSPVERILGLLAFALLVLVLIAFVRRLRPAPNSARQPVGQPGTVTSEPIEPQGTTPAPSPRSRRAPPAEAVRRWYAETLELLRRRELDKEPSLTPAEFAAQVAAALPVCAASFAELTRAYEDVRYGHRSIPEPRLSEVAAAHRSLARILAREP
ncbi:MAG TPA: DUF4129 domain-containing protein [Actinomycetota bacterium]|nr:DUF4129 domain-containing protein [Actinomycetota bacterium]